MKAEIRLITIFLLILASPILIWSTGCENNEVQDEPMPKKTLDVEDSSMNKKFYSFTMDDIDGNSTPLSTYSGKVVLVVNVASQCGYTKQYAGLQELYEKYKDQGFVILGFPANNFGGQEPGTEIEIKTFCTTKFNVTFPMFSKISVKGKDIHPLYQYLTNPEENGVYGETVTWNFNKYLIDKTGKTIGYFGTRTKPLSSEITEAVEAALKEE
ncbi:MAG: glutathione peroxidase [Phycisphaerae bacterium]|nr:glutathione peroxidase [Phycisphaerae bacterium]